MAAARTGNAQLASLFAAGVPIVQVEDDALATLGVGDRAGRRLAIDALRALMDGIEGHVALSISGGDASAIGPDVLYAAAFSSHGFDLVHGPDGWRSAQQAPRERGLVLGVADCRTNAPDYVPLSVWAARYGASMGARGLERIGLAPSAGLELLPLDAARQKLRRLAQAADVAALPTERMRDSMPKNALTRGTLPGRTLVPRRRSTRHPET